MFRPNKVMAALLLPPPSPLPAGIDLVTSILTPPPLPVWFRRSSVARWTRFLPSQGTEGSLPESRMSRPGVGNELQNVRQVDRLEKGENIVVAVGPFSQDLEP